MKIINEDILLEDSDLLTVKEDGKDIYFLITVNSIPYVLLYSDLYYVYIEGDYKIAGFSRWVHYKYNVKSIKNLSRHVSSTQRLIREIKEAVNHL